MTALEDAAQATAARLPAESVQHFGGVAEMVTLIPLVWTAISAACPRAKPADMKADAERALRHPLLARRLWTIVENRAEEVVEGRYEGRRDLPRKLRRQLVKGLARATLEAAAEAPVERVAEVQRQALRGVRAEMATDGDEAETGNQA